MDKPSVDFFEKNPPIKYLLEHVSGLATDCDPFNKNQEKFTLKIYGRITNPINDSVSTSNLAPYQLGYDILRKIPLEMYLIKIHSIEMPIQLA